MSKTPHKSPPADPPLLSAFLFQPTPEKENDRIDCAICLCSLSKVDCDISETKCKHLFHQNCLDEMKSKTKSQCPICRAPLTPPSNPPSVSSLSTQPFSAQNNSTFYSHQFINHSHNPHHSATQASIVNAARRGREAVRMAIISRSRGRGQISDDAITLFDGISTF